MELTQRQQDIVNAAISIIAEHGYKELTTKNLAQRMQLTEAALYRHFSSKHDLILKILDFFETISASVLSEISRKQLSPLERVHSFVMNRYRLFTANPELAKVIFSEELFRFDPEFLEHMQRITHSHAVAVISYLKDAQKQGLISSRLAPQALFRIIVGSMRFTVTQWNLCGQSFDLVKEGEKLFQTIKQLIEVKQ